MLSADLIPQADIISSYEDLNNSAIILFQEPEQSENIQVVFSDSDDSATTVANEGAQESEAILSVQAASTSSVKLESSEASVNLGVTSVDDPGSTVAQLTETLHVANAPPLVATVTDALPAMVFEPNVGQTKSEATFLSRGPGYTLFLTDDAAVLRLSGGENGDAVVRADLVGANPTPAVAGFDPLPGVTNYLNGSDASQWFTGIPNYSKVKYNEVYPGIDLVYYGSVGRLEYDWLVSPGADPRQIALRFDGSSGLVIDASGNLLVHTNGDDLIQRAPVLYQQTAAGRVSVDGHWQFRTDGTVGFAIGDYDRSLPLVIDPVLSYSTYVGGSGNDAVNDLAVDKNGRTIVVGTTISADFPTQSFSGTTVLQPQVHSASVVAFVTAFDAAGGRVFSTYLGGENDRSGEREKIIFDPAGDYTETFGYQWTNHHGTAVAVDPDGNIYIAGSTRQGEGWNGQDLLVRYIGFPIVGGFQSQPVLLAPSAPGVNNAVDSGFLAVLDPLGTTIIHSTYLQPVTPTSFLTSNVIIADLVLDSAGAVYISGDVDENAFVTKLTPTAELPGTPGYKLNPGWTQVLGGSGRDEARAMALDPQGRVVIVGLTQSTDFFLVNPTQFINASNPIFDEGTHDAFVAIVNADGEVIFSTYLGGPLADDAHGVAVDASGLIYVSGSSASTKFASAGNFIDLHFPDVIKVHGPDLLEDANSLPDAFVATLDPSGLRPLRAAIIGSFNSELNVHVALGGGGTVWLAGTIVGDFFSSVGNSSFPQVHAFQPPSSFGDASRGIANISDGFVAQLSADLKQLLFSSLFGGAGHNSLPLEGLLRSGRDTITALVVDASGAVHFGGWTSSDDLTTVHAAQSTFGGGDGIGTDFGLFTNTYHGKLDGFVAVIRGSSVVLGLPSEATAGVPFTGPVATFASPGIGVTEDDFNPPQIFWGDGQESQGTLRFVSGSEPHFEVIGTHIYTQSGAYPVVVNVTSKNPGVLSPSSNINVSGLSGNQNEAVIAIDPKNPSRLFMASNTDNPREGLFVAYSTDSGKSWSSRIIASGSEGLDKAVGDPSASFDDYGNLFLSYVDSTKTTVEILLSTDGGRSFKLIRKFNNPEGVDQSSIATGPGPAGLGGSVWATFEIGPDNDSAIVVVGAPVTGLDVVGNFDQKKLADSKFGNFGDIEVGPLGRVLVTFETPELHEFELVSEIHLQLDADGLGSGGFSPLATVITSNANRLTTIKPADDHIDSKPRLTWDRTGGAHNGRVYLVYTDAKAPGSEDTDIYLRFSDDNGATWSAPTGVNDNINKQGDTSSQFWPSVAVDQKTGVVAVGWYDARNDPSQVKTQFFAALSSDGGATFTQNLAISRDFSSKNNGTVPSGFRDIDYGDYSDITIFDGRLYPALVDNSSTLTGNPDLPRFDVATASIGVITVKKAHVVISPVPIETVEDTLFSGTVATFTHPDSTRQASEFSATINWGDGTPPSQPSAVAISQPDGPGTPFVITGSHLYPDPVNGFPIWVTVHDITANLESVAVSNVSRLRGSQDEGTITIDPTNSMHLFAASNTASNGVMVAFSNDGGVTWTSRILADGNDGLPIAVGDPKAAFDRFGNLFFSYAGPGGPSDQVTLLLIANDGQSIDVVGAFPGTEDQPTVVTGLGTGGVGGSVWLTWNHSVGNLDSIIVAGAAVSGPGKANIGSFTQTTVSVGDPGDELNFGDIVVGPDGQVLVLYNRITPGLLTAVIVQLDPDGTGTQPFGAPILAAFTDVGSSDGIPALAQSDPNHFLAPEPNLTWDNSTGPHHGRVYLTYTRYATGGNPDSDIFFRYSDDNGATWSSPSLVNRDATAGSQFWPSLAVDQSTGDLAVGWHSTESDQVNKVKVQFNVAVSNDGGSSFTPAIQVSPGLSDGTVAGLDNEGRLLPFGDYTGVAFLNRMLFPIWGDNSGELEGNPNRPNFEMASARIAVARVAGAPLDVTVLPPDGLVEGKEQLERVARFTDPRPETLATADDYKAKINWGDNTTPSDGTIIADGFGGYIVKGAHDYHRFGSYRITVTVTGRGAEPGSATGTIVIKDASITTSPRFVRVVDDTLIEDKLPGPPFDDVVATFTDANPHGVVADFTAEIDWDNGNETSGLIERVIDHNGKPVFLARGANIYTDEGGYRVEVEIKSAGTVKPFEEKRSIITVGDPDLTPLAPLQISALEDVNTGGITLGHFNINGPVDFGDGPPVDPGEDEWTGEVNWGDGSAPEDVEVVLAPIEPFPGLPRHVRAHLTVFGKHTYTDAGVYLGTITITSDSGDSQSFELTATVEPDVTDQLRVSLSGPIWLRSVLDAAFHATLTLTNKTLTTIPGPFTIVFKGLRAGATLLNAAGFTAAGDPFLIDTHARIFPGQSLPRIDFAFSADPGNYVVRVYDGIEAPDDFNAAVGAMLAFEANQGQTDDEVLFLSRGQNSTLFLTSDGALLRLDGADGSAAVRMQWVGGNPAPAASGVGLMATVVNYLIGNDPAAWQTNVPTYAEVRYHDVYPGIDLIYYGAEGAFEYDWIVSPGADPSLIAMQFSGADGFTLDQQGNLLLQTTSGTVTVRAPVLYQVRGAQTNFIDGHYVLDADGAVRFTIGAYDAARPLTIDPVLVYSSYLGGSEFDAGRAIATDGEGNVYIAGVTGSRDFPLVDAIDPFFTDSPNQIFFGISEAFVAKRDPQGASIFTTYLGGIVFDEATDIAVDAAGNPWIVGVTSSNDFPTTPQSGSTGVFGPQGFITQLNSTGTALLHSKLLGLSRPSAVALDGSGAVYVAGDRYVARLIPAESRIEWTIGLPFDVTDIAVDSNGNVYAVGDTEVSNLPVVNALQPNKLGARDAFVEKIDSAGNVVYATYLGGSGVMEPQDLAFGADGNLYVTVLHDPNSHQNMVLRYDGTSGAFVDEFVTLGSGGLRGASGMVFGPDGNLYLSGGISNNILRYDGTSGAFIDEFVPFRSVIFTPDGPVFTPGTLFGPEDLIFGPDGNLYVSQGSNPFLPGGVFRYHGQSGAFIDDFVPFGSGGFTSPAAIRFGPDGNLYVADNSLDGLSPKVLRYNGSTGAFIDKFVSVASPDTALAFTDLVFGPDGNLYVTAFLAGGGSDAVLRFNGTTGALIDAFVSGPDAPIAPQALLFGPDGGLYVAGSDHVRRYDGDSGAFVKDAVPPGSGRDKAWGVAVDGLGRVYVTGETNAHDFPLVNAAQSTIAGGIDGFIAVLSEDGSRLLFSSYFGGSGIDEAFSIALDGSGHAIIVGSTESTDLFTRRAIQSVYQGVADAFGRGGDDGFVVVFDTVNGQIMSSSYLGGSGDDFNLTIFTSKGADVAADANGNIYITGTTSSADFRTVNAEQALIGGLRDAVFVRLAANAPRTVDIRPVSITATEGQAFSGPVAFFTDTGDGVSADYQVLIDWGDGVVSTGTVLDNGIGGHTVIGNHSYRDSGSYPMRITVQDPDGNLHQASALPGGTTTEEAIYHIEVDTSSLLGQSGLVSLQFNPGALPGTQSATAKIRNVVLGGGALGNFTTDGGASGPLDSEPSMTNSSLLNRITQAITFGARVSFDLVLSGEALSEPLQQIFGTSFALQLLGADGLTPLLSSAPHGATVIVDIRGDGSSQSRDTGVSPAITGVAARASANVNNAPIQLTVLSFNAVEGVPFTTVVASFINNNPLETAATHTALINWGDGTAPTTGVVALAAGGGFTVTGSHVYAQVGSYLLRVAITDDDGITTKSELIISGIQAGRLAPGNSVLAVGDVNGDGTTDAIVSLVGGVEFGAALGRGDGTFTEPAIRQSAYPFSPSALGDFDGDGRADLLVAGVNGVQIIPGNGDGTFQTESRFGSGSVAFATSDVNRDGILDFVLAHSFPANISVLLGNGDGTFRNGESIPWTPNTENTSLAVSDLNLDGIPDLVTGNLESNAVFVRLGRGDGTFEPLRSFPADGGNSLAFGGPASVLVTDVNADGKPDIITANRRSNNISILLGNGDGTLQSQQRFTVGDEPLTVAVGDLNGDGKPDLVVRNQNSNDISILLGNGNGTFQTERRVAAGNGLRAVAVGDVNGDGKLDITTANFFASSGSISVFLSNGNGTFQQPNVTQTTRIADYLTIFDVSGDGRMELVAAGTGVSIFIGRGDGTFQTELRFGSDASAATVADLNADGKLDLAMQGGSGIGILLGNGGASFGATTTPIAISGVPQNFAPGDFNHDGALDLLVGHFPTFGVGVSNRVTVLLGKGDGDFQPATDYVAGIGSQVAVGDLNGDGNTDFVANSFFDNTVDVFLGRGDGSFSNPSRFAGGGAAIPFIADVTGDGARDLILGANSAVRILIGNGDGSFGSVVELSTPGFINGVTARDLNDDGLLDIAASVNNSQLSIFLGRGGEEFSNPLVFPVASAGNLVPGDFNNDGAVDLLNGSTFILGQGDGTFALPSRIDVTFGSGVVEFAIGDLDGDGFPEIVTTDGANIMITRGNGPGQFDATQPVFSGSPQQFNDMQLADVNRDARIDIIAGGRMLSGNFDHGEITVLLNQGGGQFAPPVPYDIPPKPFFEPGTVREFRIADLNGDNNFDILVDQLGYVLIGNGNGTFQPAVIPPNAIADHIADLADFNADGKLDAISTRLSLSGGTGSTSGAVLVRLGQGSGNFAPAVTYAVGVGAQDARAVDVDGNGILDIVATIAGNDNLNLGALSSPSLSVLRGRGDGTFFPATTFSLTQNPGFIFAVLDVTGDGRAETISGVGSKLMVFTNNGHGIFSGPDLFDVGLGNFVTKALVADLTGDGDPDLAFSGGGSFVEVIRIVTGGNRALVANAPLAVLGTTINPVAGVAFTAVVGTLTDENTLATAGEHTATIDWGDGTTSAATIAADGSGGFAIIGSHTYAAAGLRTITINAADDDGGTAAGNSIADVSANDQALAATPVTFTATQGVAFIAVVATFTDSDPNGNSNDFSAVIGWGDGQTSDGTIISNAQGGFNVIGSHTYANAATFNVPVTITDIGGSTASTTSTAVVAANETPVARNDDVTTAEDTPVILNVLANDIDADGAALSALLVAAPLHGTATLNPDGSFRYAPAGDFNGSDFFTYIANDGTSNSNIATVRITVTAVNDAPKANPDSFSVAEDGQLIIAASNLLVNDSAGPADESGQTLRVIGVAGGANAHGTLSFIGGIITYTPDPDYNGAASFSYIVEDNGTTNGAADPKQATGKVTLAVTEVNDAPKANADSFSVAEDDKLAIGASALLANDTAGPANENSQTLTVIAVSGTAATHGTVSLTGSTINYTPDKNYSGPASFNYTIQDNGTTNGAQDPKQATGTVTITVAPINDAPVLTGVNVNAIEGAPFTALVANFTDVDQGALAGDYSAIIEWGDGTSSPGIIVSNGAGSFDVIASHMYVEEGSYLLRVTVQDMGGGAVTIPGVPAEAFPTAANYLVGRQPVSVAVSDLNGDGNLDVVVANRNGLSVLIGDGHGIFQTAVSYAAGDRPNAVVAADFNRDGKADLAASSRSGVSVLLGNGDGTFQAAVIYASGLSLSALVAGDFNGDSKIDLAAGNGSNLSVLLGSGDGTFGAAINSAAGGNSGSLTTGDFNRDGKSDIALIASNGVRVLLGNGDGSFAAPANYAAGASPAAVAMGDFNADANPDLAVANFSSNNVSVLLGNGDGTFGAAANYAAGQEPFALTAGDFNRDGKSDLAVANFFTNDVSVLLGNGDGTFRAPVNYAAGSQPFSIATGDFNGDGNPDLAVANRGSDDVSVIFGTGDGRFLGVTSYLAGATLDSADPAGLAVGDFTGDGLVDLAVANEVGSFNESRSSLGLLVNKGDGTFHSATDHDGGEQPNSVAVGDFNRDSLRDLVTAGLGSFFGGSGVNVLLGNGNGTFQTPVNYAAGTNPASVAVGDFNNDDDLDIAVANRSSNDVSVLLGNGDGTFRAALSYAAGISPVSLGIGDFNGDNFLDLAVANRFGNDVSVLLGNGDGTFQAGVNYAAGQEPFSLAVADFDEDATADLAVANRSSNDVSILLGNGDGTFQSPVNYAAGVSPVSVAVGDFNGDEVLDLVTASTGVFDSTTSTVVGDGVNTLHGNGDGTFKPAVNYALGEDPGSVVVGDFNRDGADDIAVAIRSSLSINVLLTIPPTPVIATVADAPLTATGSTIRPPKGEVFTAAVASFTDANPFGNLADFATTIDWGDGSVSAGLIAGNASDGFTVTGTHTYAVDASFAIRVDIVDVGGSTATAHSRALVGAFNTAPLAQDDQAVTNEGTAVVIDVLVNDSDAENDSLHAVLVSSPAHGQLALEPNGAFTYAPAINFSGNDSFTYKVNDGRADSNVGTVRITVGAVNDAPIALNDAASTSTNTPVAIDVLSNDIDVENDVLRALLIVGPAHGSAFLNSNGSISYTPATDYFGFDSFTYRANDGFTNSNIATVSISVIPLNARPVAANDSATTNENTSITINVLANDTDSDGAIDPFSVAIASMTAHGILSIDPSNRMITYTPQVGFSGSDSFRYTVKDNQGLVSNQATVSIVVVEQGNAAPVATGESYTTNEDTALLVVGSGVSADDPITVLITRSIVPVSNGPLIITGPAVLGNDSDSDGDLLSAILVAGPAHGTLSLNSSGAFSYLPAVNFNGTDSFTYKANDGTVDSNIATVIITVTAVNDAPIAANDSYSIDADTTLNVTAQDGVLVNDADVDGNALSALLVGGPAHGILTLNSNGSFTYTPAANFNGSDRFSYRANDGQADSDVAAVSITVNAVNDAPVAVNDGYTTNEDTTLTVSVVQGVLVNDTDVENDSLSAILVSDVSNGTLTLNPNGSFTYTPALTFTGSDGFSYKANDGQADSNIATVNIAINAINHVPVANDDTATTNEDTPIIINVGDNDTDADRDTLTVIVVSQPANGTAVSNGDGTVTYRPSLNFSGQGSFTYQVSDGQALSNVASVTIEVIPSNHAPLAQDDFATTDEDTPKIIDVLANDTDADGDTLVINAITQPTNGHVVGNGDGSLIYTPDANFYGVDSFSYTIGDGNGESSTATVTATVLSVNDAPVITAMEGSAVINEGETVTLRGAFSDPDLLDQFSLMVNWGDGSIEVFDINDGKNFTLSHRYLDDNPTGTPSDNYDVAVQLTDNNGGSAEAGLSVVVNNVAPVANLTGSSSGVRGQTLDFAGSITDVGILDSHQVRWDFGDGAVIGYQAASAEALNVHHVYSSSGTYTVKLSVRDDDGGTATVSKQITIKAVDIQTDPCDSTKTALVVGGTNGDDKIRFVPQGNNGEIKVLINGASQGIFKPTGRIIAVGLGGDDDIEITGSISLAAILQGDAGNDRLKSGAGASVLCGGDGDDYLIGGSGRSILIGDRGADRLVGTSEDDILIGGTTQYDCDHEALCEILETWTRRDLTYTQRVSRLSSGPFALNSTTVFDDGAADQLTGAAGLDWFFVGINDKITDRHAFETVG